jgi:orotidine-5'-phosphate decarboxylase
MSGSRNPLIAALDTADGAEAERLAAALADTVAFVKAGLTLFVAEGPEAILRLRERAPVFLDLKLHDIPAQVEGAARAAARLDVGLLTVHALGGVEMVSAAVRGAEQGAAEAGTEPPGILGVTVLSSLGGEGLASPASLAYEAVSAGARGVVVSGEDVAVVRETIGPQALVVVPGIRPAGHANNDQVRVLTPGEALERGADYLVIGRPITGSPDPAGAARAILVEVGLA